MFTQINVNGTDKIEQLMLTGINKSGGSGHASNAGPFQSAVSTATRAGTVARCRFQGDSRRQSVTSRYWTLHSEIPPQDRTTDRQAPGYRVQRTLPGPGNFNCLACGADIDSAWLGGWCSHCNYRGCSSCYRSCSGRRSKLESASIDCYGLHRTEPRPGGGYCGCRWYPVRAPSHHHCLHAAEHAGSGTLRRLYSAARRIKRASYRRTCAADKQLNAILYHLNNPPNNNNFSS